MNRIGLWATAAFMIAAPAAGHAQNAQQDAIGLQQLTETLKTVTTLNVGACLNRANSQERNAVAQWGNIFCLKQQFTSLRKDLFIPNGCDVRVLLSGLGVENQDQKLLKFSFVTKNQTWDAEKGLSLDVELSLGVVTARKTQNGTRTEVELSAPEYAAVKEVSERVQRACYPVPAQ